jgi:hypothetical protein
MPSGTSSEKPPVSLAPTGGFSVMTDSIKFDRKPYIVHYVDQEGKQQSIRRVPPPKLHTAMPTDKVELTKKLSDNFDAGDELTVKSINPRHANILKVENGQGQTTFISHYDMKVKDKIAPRLESEAAASGEDIPIQNDYLLWP